MEEDMLINYINSCGAVRRIDVENYMGVKKQRQQYY